MIAYGTAGAGNGVTVKAWDTSLNSGNGGWETLSEMGNTDSSMPTESASAEITSNLANYIDGEGKVTFLVHTNNPSTSSIVSSLKTDLMKLEVLGEYNNLTPNTPVLNNYNDGATVADATPTLSFDLSDGDESDEGENLKYQVQIDDNADFASPEIDYTEADFGSAPRAGTEFTTSGLESGKWYWRVKAIDDGGLESAWATASNGFVIDVSLPVSKILYPQNQAKLKNVKYILGKTTDNEAVDYTRVSIRDLSTGKYYTGTDFSAETETWITTNQFGSGKRTRWYIAAPTWEDFHTYTIRSRGMDTAGNEEHTDAITFTYDTVNGAEGSIYVSNPGVDNNSDYQIFYPNNTPVPNGGYVEVDFDDTFAFSPWMDDASIELSDQGGGISASTDTIDRSARTIQSRIVTGNVGGSDMIELSINNLMIHNPSATGAYLLPIKIYNSGGTLLESGTGTITLVENYQQVEVNVEIEQSLQLRVDSGSVLLEVDPDVQLGQNWTGTGGAVMEKTEVEVKTNAQGGYNLMISLAGNTATGSAVLDGQVLSGSQITSTDGDRVAVENNFTFGLNSGTAATVTAFNNASTQVSGAGSSNATNSYIDNIFYYLNIDYTTPADTYAGTVTYTAVGQF